MVMPPGVEPGTCSLGESRSIQLSYGTRRVENLEMISKIMASGFGKDL